MRIKEARLIAIDNLLSSLGIHPAKQCKGGNELWYSSPIREGDINPSFKLDKHKNFWFDFGVSKGGDIIDLVCQLNGGNRTIKEALALLDKSAVNLSHSLEINANKVNDSFPFAVNPAQLKIQNLPPKKLAGEKEKSLAFEVLEVAVINQLPLIHFLNDRRINFSIAKKYLKQVHYKPKNKVYCYYALAWACGDGYEVRSPAFKGFIGLRKDIIKINLRDNQTLSIFEGFMDFLAFLSYFNYDNFQSSVIILNSINLKDRALKEIKKFNFSKVYLFLDNDKGGEATKDFFKSSLGALPIVDKSCLYQHYNDFNEMLIEESKNVRN